MSKPEEKLTIVATKKKPAVSLFVIDLVCPSVRRTLDVPRQSPAIAAVIFDSHPHLSYSTWSFGVCFHRGLCRGV
jgi:hypothetical protein